MILNNKKDALGDRIKNNYEDRSKTYLPRRTYTVIRIDQKNAHNYTKHLERPYDLGYMEDMNETARYLCENLQGCKLAYVQSDECSLVLTDFDSITSDALFGGAVQKITSITASMATAKFNQLRYLPMTLGRDNNHDDEGSHNQMIENAPLAHFDSRCFVVPDPEELFHVLLWRQLDATRNAIQMSAQSEFSHKQLQNKNCNQLQEMLFQEKGINFNDYPDGFKRGRCVVKEKYMAPVFNGEGEVERSRWVITVPPIFTQDRDWIWKYIPDIRSKDNND